VYDVCGRELHTRVINDFKNGLQHCQDKWDKNCKCELPKMRPPTPQELQRIEELTIFAGTLTLMLLALVFG
jgi:hypothetical protein